MNSTSFVHVFVENWQHNFSHLLELRQLAHDNECSRITTEMKVAGFRKSFLTTFREALHFSTELVTFFIRFVTCFNALITLLRSPSGTPDTRKNHLLVCCVPNLSCARKLHTTTNHSCSPNTGLEERGRETVRERRGMLYFLVISSVFW